MDKLHYHGKLPKQPENKVFGPDMFGAWYRPMSQRYDIYDDRTTIFFQPVAPADLPEHMAAYSKQIVAQRKDPQQWLSEVVGVLCRNRKWSNLLRPFLTSMPGGVPPRKVVPADSESIRLQKELLKRFRTPG